MIRVFIADDHALIREGFKRIISNQKDMEIVGEAANAGELFQFLESQECDIVVLDVSMPGKTGLDILQDMQDFYPEVKVLMLSMHPIERFALRSLRSGAYGYLTKEVASDKLVEAIRIIHSGRKYVPEAVIEQMITGLDSPKEPSPDMLSQREFQVFLKLANGKSVTDTAQELSLSQSTVNTYRARIMEKLQFKSTADLIRYAIKNRYVE